MKDLLFFVLRLLLQLVIFAITGRWPHFARSQPARVQPPKTKPKPARAPLDRLEPHVPSPAPTRAWSYRDEGAAYAPDAPPREGGPARVRPPPKPARPNAATRSLGRALRDRRVLRDALILDAALGSRGPPR